MKHLTSLLASCLFLLSTLPAAAHRPYFTQVEKIRLPSGDIGEARLLAGDGILGPDPVRVLILDVEGRLLARSHKSTTIRLSCREDGQCLIFDLARDRVLDLDAGTFRRGDIVPGLTDEDRNKLWDLEDGRESWGFSPRSPALSERPSGIRMLLSYHLPVVSLNLLTGGACLLLATTLLRIARTYRNRWAVAIAGLALTAVGLFVFALSGFFSLMDGLSMKLWLAALTVGAGVFWIVRYVRPARSLR